MKFLVEEKGFKYVLPRCPSFPGLLCISSEERVRKGAEKLQKYLNSKQQGRLDGFFTVKPKPEGSPKKEKGKGEGKGKEKGTKRKVCLFLRCKFFLD